MSSPFILAAYLGIYNVIGAALCLPGRHQHREYIIFPTNVSQELATIVADYGTIPGSELLFHAAAEYATLTTAVRNDITELRRVLQCAISLGVSIGLVALRTVPRAWNGRSGALVDVCSIYTTLLTHTFSTECRTIISTQLADLMVLMDHLPAGVLEDICQLRPAALQRLVPKSTPSCDVAMLHFSGHLLLSHAIVNPGKSKELILTWGSMLNKAFLENVTASIQTYDRGGQLINMGFLGL